MQISLRPYITTGVALVGATVIAAAPMQPVLPADLQIANPVAQVEQAVELTANEIQNAVNQLVFAATKAGVSVAQLTTPLVAQILGIPEPAAAAFLAIGTIGLLGPLISGTGAIGTALQHIVDSDGIEELLVNLVGAPGTIIDGLVNGNFGPNLASLINPLFPPTFAGGLINPGNILLALPPWTVPGTIPTLQGLVEQLFGLFSPAAMNIQNVSALATPTPDSTVEDGINSLLLGLTKATLSVVTLAAPLVAPILGVTEPQAAAFLALGTVGLFGPLISGTGAVGAALQDIVNSDGLEELVSNFIGAPGTVIDGVVNGGYGPNLLPVLGGYLPPAIPIGVNPITHLPIYAPVTAVFAPGIIQNPGFIYNPLLLGLGLRIGGTPTAPTATLLPPGTIAVLQGLVERVFGALPSAASLNTSTLKTPAGEQNAPEISNKQSNLTLSGKGETGLDETNTDSPAVAPKKHQHLINVDVFNPLGNLGGAKKDTKDNVSSVNSNNDAPGKHRIGTPVRDLIHSVLGGSHEQDDNDEGTSAQSTDDAPE
jgi:hypothetical protein